MRGNRKGFPIPPIGLGFFFLFVGIGFIAGTNWLVQEGIIDSESAWVGWAIGMLFIGGAIATFIGYGIILWGQSTRR